MNAWDTYTQGERVTWLYRPAGRRQQHRVAVVVAQDGKCVMIRVWGADGSYTRRTTVEDLYKAAEEKLLAATRSARLLAMSDANFAEFADGELQDLQDGVLEEQWQREGC